MSSRELKTLNTHSPGPPQRHQRARLVRAILVGVGFLVVGFHLFTGIDDTPFHGDEPSWATVGYYYFQLMFVQHDYTPSKWNRPEFREFGLLSLPVGKYIIGLALTVALPRGNYHYLYDWSKSESANQTLGNIPPLSVLRPARIMSALFSLATLIMLFWICTEAWSWLSGLLCVLSLAFNPLFSLFAHRAMTDAYLIFFMILSAVCCTFLLKAGIRKVVAFLILCSLTGLVGGLCASIKLNGLITLGYLGLAIVLVAFQNRHPHRSKFFFPTGMLLGAVTTAFVMVAINPYFYAASLSEVVERFQYLYTSWNKLLTYQQRIFPLQAISGDSSLFVIRLATDYIHPALSLFGAVGLVATIPPLITKLRARSIALDAVPLIVFSINVVAIGFWIPLDWDRYYLPVVVAAYPFIAVGISTIIGLMVRRIVPQLEPYL